MNTFSKADLTNEMISQTETIYQNNLLISASQKTQEAVETEIELMTAALYNSILHETNIYNGKLKYTNDEMRKTALVQQADLSVELKTLKAARLNDLEAQSNLKADTEKRRKTFRIAELNLLWLIENGAPANDSV
jgi:hypothetical protein